MQKNGLYWITGIAILLCMACAAVQAADINYEKVTIKEIMDGNSLSSGRAVQIEGTIEKECPARGCWLVVNDGTGSLLVDQIRRLKYRCQKVDFIGSRVLPSFYVWHVLQFKLQISIMRK